MTKTKKLRRIFRLLNLVKILTLILIFCLLLSYLAPFIHPSNFKLIPFFGLAYPVFISLAILFLLFWIFKKSKYALFITITILIGGKLHFRMLAIGEDLAIPENKKSQVWQIMSYNVRLFDLYNWYEDSESSKRKEIFNYLKDQNLDVVCFQEFYQQDKPTKFPTRDSLTKVLKMSEYHERYSYKLYGRQNFGICMFSKYPIIEKGEVAFGNENEDTDNYCIYADIVKGTDTLRVYNIHLQSIKFRKDDYTVFAKNKKTIKENKSAVSALFEKLQIAYPRRANQAILIMEHVRTSKYPVIVCGDFNDTPMSYVYSQFSKDLLDSYRKTSKGIGSTYVGKIPAGRIDYIFYSKSLSASNFKVQKRPLSDHRAISCFIWKSDV